MDILEKYGHLIILICLGTMAAVNFSTKDITIRDTVSVIGFVIVFLTVVPLAIYRKTKKIVWLSGYPNWRILSPFLGGVINRHFPYQEMVKDMAQANQTHYRKPELALGSIGLF
ncbi:hypothetical protein P7H06_13915 [Paenibacillus larvae]|nr:hypothetical protein [Paenibacillus larvae]MDT2260387.1 hypothetical protein [Paenibacillus larvae]